MKTPTVDNLKPKRDKLGPTGPANITDAETKRGEETRPKKLQLQVRHREHS